MFILNSLCIKENPNKQVKLNLRNFIFVVFTLKKKIVLCVDITKNKQTKKQRHYKDITSNAQSLSAAQSFFILLGKKYISWNNGTFVELLITNLTMTNSCCRYLKIHRYLRQQLPIAVVNSEGCILDKTSNVISENFRCRHYFEHGTYFYAAEHFFQYNVSHVYIFQ